ncbi:MAG: hypothetical protein AAF514_24695, partial [Verrucomicrobiota bacterium]
PFAVVREKLFAGLQLEMEVVSGKEEIYRVVGALKGRHFLFLRDGEPVVEAQCEAGTWANNFRVDMGTDEDPAVVFSVLAAIDFLVEPSYSCFNQENKGPTGLPSLLRENDLE